MSKKYILAVDEGTTGTRAALLNREGEIIAIFYREFTQYFPRAGFLAGLGIGYWKEKEIPHLWKREAVFLPRMRKGTREKLYGGWQKAVARILTSSQKGT